MAKAFLYALGEVEDASSLQDDRCVDIISCSAAPANAANLKLWSVMELVLNYAKNCARGSRGVPIFWAVAHRTGHSVGCDEIATADGVVAVGATDAENRVRGSVSGPALDLVAPGIDVAVLKGTDTFHYTHGTSYATPHVAGIAARLLEIRPDLTASQIVDTLRLTANKRVGEPISFDERGHHDRYGHGIVDAWTAVKCVRLGL
jgi:subtilisin family serine protease